MTALAAASVSERARELEQAQRLAVSLWERNYKESSPDWKVDETLTGVLLQISNMVSGMSLRSNADNRFADLVVSLRDHAKWGRGGRFTSPHDSKGTSRLLDMAADAIEQALTQQRGHGEAVDRDAWAEALELPEGYTVEEFLPDGWHYAWTRADGERMVSGTTWNHPALAAIAAWQYAPTTTPQPSADAVREDSARLDWIESQIREYGDGYTEPREAGWCIQWQQGRTDHYWPGLRAWIDEERRRASGDELESLLGRDG